MILVILVLHHKINHDHYREQEEVEGFNYTLQWRLYN